MILEILIDFFVVIFGLCIGSFLNCIIYRLEKEKSLSGRSFCPNCKHILSWLDLFPVFSWIFLAGKCRYCKDKISIQYPLVEIFTAILFLLLFILTPHYNIFGLLNLIFILYIASSLIIIFVYDFKHYLIPDKVLFPAMGVALIYDFINYHYLLNNILAAIGAVLFFLIIFFISKGRAMGFGDVKLVFLMGLLLGATKVLTALFLAFFFGAIIGVILMLWKKKGLKSEIPFGPFLITGTFLAMFFGNQIIQWYLHLFLI